MTDITKKEEKSLSIRLKEKQIADIIVNFLGKKEKLSYEDEKFFTLRLNDIEQFYYLINEKISKEQFTKVNLFTVTFLFNDKTTRVINTIESLNKYIETRDVIATAVTLTWHVVLQFPNVDTIETQKIELSFDSKSGSGEISLNIEHTNQSWGIEILNLMKDKILSVSYSIPAKIKIAGILKKELYTAKTIIFILYFSMMTAWVLNLKSSSLDSKNNFIIFEEYKKNKIPKKEFDTYSYIIEKFNEEDEVQLITKYITNSKEKEHLLEEYKKQNIEVSDRTKLIAYGTISTLLIYALLFFYLTKYIRYYSKNSHILTTNRSTINYKEYKDKKNKMQFYSISLIFFTISTGLIVNFIYSFIG